MQCFHVLLSLRICNSEDVSIIVSYHYYYFLAESEKEFRTIVNKFGVLQSKHMLYIYIKKIVMIDTVPVT